MATFFKSKSYCYPTYLKVNKVTVLIASRKFGCRLNRPFSEIISSVSALASCGSICDKVAVARIVDCRSRKKTGH